jgi:LPXTG-site transpeptidase (sortase) family protein
MYSNQQENIPKNKGKISKKFFERHDVLFLAVFGAVFFITLAIFTFIGFVPKEISPMQNGGSNGTLSLESQSNYSLFGVDFMKGSKANKIQKVSEIPADDLPVRIVISKADVDFKIINPESTDLSFLDNELSLAPVRYPGSGTISAGNIFIFGHSTGFKIVQNPAYKVFNNLKKLKVGDEITIYSMSGKTHVYSVVSGGDVKKEDTWIDFSANKPSLTLSTCDRLSQLGDRYVVHAVRVQ